MLETLLSWLGFKPHAHSWSRCGNDPRKLVCRGCAVVRWDYCNEEPENEDRRTEDDSD